MSIQDLIERLEKATGPDRKLDIAIAFAVGRVRERDGNYLYAIGNNSDMVVEPNEYDDHLVAQPLSYYTASIDAALTLVPEGWQWSVSNRAPEPHAGRAYLHNRELQFAGIGGMRKNPAYLGSECTAATPAIALCIAALKARQAMTIDQGQ